MGEIGPGLRYAALVVLTEAAISARLFRKVVTVLISAIGAFNANFRCSHNWQYARLLHQP